MERSRAHIPKLDLSHINSIRLWAQSKLRIVLAQCWHKHTAKHFCNDFQGGLPPWHWITHKVLITGSGTTQVSLAKVNRHGGLGKAGQGGERWGDCRWSSLRRWVVPGSSTWARFPSWMAQPQTGLLGFAPPIMVGQIWVAPFSALPHYPGEGQ